MASKLFLLPLVPALAFGMVEVASRIMPAPTPAPIAPSVVMVVEPAPPAPIKPTVIEEPPVVMPEPPCNHGCVTSD